MWNWNGSESNKDSRGYKEKKKNYSKERIIYFERFLQILNLRLIKSRTPNFSRKWKIIILILA